jgi:hypothetical protein
MNTDRAAIFTQLCRAYIERLQYSERALYASAWMETLLGWRSAPDIMQYKISTTMTTSAQYREGEKIRTRIYQIADQAYSR